MPRAIKTPVSSFGPELLEALLRGGREKFIVQLSSSTEAAKLRSRLYALRSAMRREDHPETPLAYRASIPVATPDADGKWTLIIRPADSQFTAALHAAGISLSRLPSNPLDALDYDEQRPAPSVFANLLRNVEPEK